MQSRHSNPFNTQIHLKNFAQVCLYLCTNMLFTYISSNMVIENGCSLKNQVLLWINKKLFGQNIAPLCSSVDFGALGVKEKAG